MIVLLQCYYLSYHNIERAKCESFKYSPCLYEFLAPEVSLARYGVTFANNSVIDIILVGKGYPGIAQTESGALECHTDDLSCCRGIDNPNATGRGEWYDPDGNIIVPPLDNDVDGFYKTRGHMVIRLNRGGNIYTLTN